MRITAVLARVPVIKFRKGQTSSHGSGAASAGPGGAPASTPSTSAATSPPPRVQMQPAAAMSTAPISDIDLPPRYRRRPLSQEEIDHINGGGEDTKQSVLQKEPEVAVKVPHHIHVQYGKKRDIISFKILLQKIENPQ